MLLLKNQQVKIIFKNGITIEGIVIQWDHKEEEYKYVLKALDDNSLFIINNQEDIMVIKIVDNSGSEEQEEVQEEVQKEEELESNFNEIKGQVDEVYEQPRHNLDDIKTLANLRKKLVESEKQLIANKLKQHHIKNPKGVKYEHGFFKK